jgi:uncharacterized protein (DUF433 family)
MNALNVLHAGQADALASAAKVLQPKPDAAPAAVLKVEAEAVQHMIDDAVRLADQVGRQLTLAWELLAAGRIDNPQQAGEHTLPVAESTRALLGSLEESGGAWVAQGTLRIDLGALVGARDRLERQAKHFRENWPMITPESVAEARRCYDEAGHPTFEEFARQAGYDPGNAPLELPVPGWHHLVVRKHPWRRQLFLAGRNLTARQLVNTVRVNHWSEDEAAKNLDLPVEAVREALRYASENAKLLAAEAEYERLSLARRGHGRGTRAVPR